MIQHEVRHGSTQRYAPWVSTRRTLEHSHGFAWDSELADFAIELEDFGVSWRLGVEGASNDLGDAFEGETEAPRAN